MAVKRSTTMEETNPAGSLWDLGTGNNQFHPTSDK